MQHHELDGIAAEAYREARQDAERPDVELLARRLLGPDAIWRGPRPVHGPAALVRVLDRWCIVLGRSVPLTEAMFFLGHELGHWLLRRHGVPVHEEEAAADYLAAALLAPRAAFMRARRELGEDLRGFAERFTMSETAAALRLGEVLARPLAVVAPARVRVRGPEAWVWPDERTLRAWARRPGPGVRKTRLTDDPRRVVLEADDA